MAGMFVISEVHRSRQSSSPKNKALARLSGLIVAAGPRAGEQCEFGVDAALTISKINASILAY